MGKKEKDKPCLVDVLRRVWVLMNESKDLKEAKVKFYGMVTEFILGEKSPK